MRRASPTTSTMRRLRLERDRTPSFDWPTLIANKDREIARLETAYTANLDNAGVEIAKSRAVLEDAHTVRLLASGERVRAGHVLIATGAAPYPGETIPGIEHGISSNEAFHLAELPRRILIQGGGYIAVEFACIFAGLGSEVTLVYRGENILRGFDDDVRTHLREEMKRRGIDVRCGHTVIGIDQTPLGLYGAPLRRQERDGRPGDVRDRAAAERRRHRARGARASRSRPRAAGSRSTSTRRPRRRTSTRSATSPTGSTSRRSRSARATPSPTPCSAAEPTRGRPHQRADGGVLRARGRRDRPHRDPGARALVRGRRLSRRRSAR